MKPWKENLEEMVEISEETFHTLKKILEDINGRKSLTRSEIKDILDAWPVIERWSKDQRRLILGMAISILLTPPFNYGIGESHRALEVLCTRIKYSFDGPFELEYGKPEDFPHLTVFFRYDSFTGDSRSLWSYRNRALVAIGDVSNTREDAIAKLYHTIDFKTTERILENKVYKEWEDKDLVLHCVGLIEPLWVWKWRGFGSLPEKLTLFKEIRKVMRQHLLERKNEELLELEKHFIEEWNVFFPLPPKESIE